LEPGHFLHHPFVTRSAQVNDEICGVPLKFETCKADMAIEWQERKLRSVSDQPNSEEKLMSTSAVSSISLNQQLQSFFQTRNSDVQQLGKALSSGNLAQAQVAYNNITAVGQGGPFASGNSFRSSQRQQDISAIGQALQSGDLAGAQQAFAALQSTGKASDPLLPAGGVSNPLLPGGTATPASAAGPEIVVNLSNSSSASPEQLTINIGQSSSGGEQVSLSVGNQGSNAQQVTFNLGSNTNEQIVINLLDSPASGGVGAGTPATSSTSGGLSVSA
jgi:hypothetical protein